MGPSLETPEPPKPPGPPRLLGPTVSQDPIKPRDPLDLWTPGPPGPQDLRSLGKLPLPFEIQNLNTQKL